MSSKSLDRLVENLQESPHSHPHEAIASNQQPDLFSFTVPTTFVELPSMGLFYPEDHPLYGEEAVEIKFMTAKEEDILTSQALIRKNLVIDRSIASLLVDKRIDPGSLLVGDRSAIILEARKTAYGTDYNIGLSGAVTGDLSIEDTTISGTLKDTTVSGTMVIEESNLAIKNINININGKLRPKFEPIPIPLNIDFNADFVPAYASLDFPISINKEWNIPYSDIYITGDISLVHKKYRVQQWRKDGVHRYLLAATRL